MNEQEELLPGRFPRERGPSAGPRGGADVAASRTSLPAPDMGAVDLYIRAGDFSSALKALADAARMPEHAADLGVTRRTAYCLEKLSRYSDVIALLDHALADSPAPSAFDARERGELARCRLILGKALLEAGRMAEAEVQGQLALAAVDASSSGPEIGFVRNLLGGIHFRRGDTEEARIHFRAALEHFRRGGDVTNLALAYINLGHLHKQHCEWDRALEHYQAAYYLRATEGEFQDQGAILQNLGLVLMKVGRFEEATEKLESSLRRAIEMGDPARALRARLALARLHRESWHSDDAKAVLAEANAQAPVPAPGREGCLLLIEAAFLARFEGRADEGAHLADQLRARVGALAARGDLMIESLILDGLLALDRDDTAEAEDDFRRAFDMAREDRDLFAENRALLALLELHLRRSEAEAASEIVRTLHDRHLRSGEQPALARVMLCAGRLEQDVRGDARKALEWYTRARDLWRRMDCPRLEAVAELRLAGALADLDRGPEAGATLHRVRERLEPADLGAPALAGLLADLEERLTDGPATVTEPTIDGGRAWARLEELLLSSAGTGEKLRGLLLVMVEALEGDGGLLARVGRDGLEVVSSVSMGRLQGKRQLAPAVLGADPQRAALRRNLRGLDGREEAVVALSWPVELFGRPHIAWVERREPGRAPWTRGDLDYGHALLAGAARALRPLVPERPLPTGGALSQTGPAGAVAGGAATPYEILDGAIHLADVVTQNHRMLGILELVRKVAGSDLTVLLQGETGTGKKLLAEIVHRAGHRCDRPFVTVDCAALPDSLLESELFGHRKGAFTGAAADRVGLLEEANGGTIFLDEIDKAGLSVQRRFLHMLDSGEVRPVGATSYKRLDVRVVCATSCPDLRQEVAAGRFLKDLFYRLNDIAVTLPALRERPDDIVLLAEWFAERSARKLGRTVAGLSPSFRAALVSHAWPGNVRELEKAVRRAVTLAEDGAVLGPELLPTAVLESLDSNGEPGDGTLRSKVEQYECGLILHTLDRLGWNKSRAAVDLGLSRRGLKGKIERYRLDRRRSRR
jgi:DNA-binding NtrC family response regulator/tetratricopeptide (TPR) repeat protein